MTIFFYLFAVLITISSTCVVFSKNPVYSVLWLIFAFCNGSGLMILLEAEFLAMMLIVIYVGAVAVLFLFVIMMLDINLAHTISEVKRNLPLSMIVAFIMITDLVIIILLGAKQIDLHKGQAFHTHIASLSSRGSVETQNTAPTKSNVIGKVNPPGYSNTRAIGNVLYTDFILPFQMAGIILFAAMISCITLTLRHRPYIKRQNIAQQNSKNKANSILMTNPKLNQGVEDIQYD